MAVVGRNRRVSPSPTPVCAPNERSALVFVCGRSSAPVWMRSPADTAGVEYAWIARRDWECGADSYTSVPARHSAHAIISTTVHGSVKHRYTVAADQAGGWALADAGAGVVWVSLVTGYECGGRRASV